MIVSAIKQQVKNPNRVNVFIDGKYTFSLSLDELLAERLKKDQQIDEARLKVLKKLSADGKLRTRTLEWLLNRPHSTRELRDYLYRKKADPALTEKLVKEFAARKYLNDEAYGHWLVELRKRAGKSNRAIRAELFKKGLSRQIADEVLATKTNGEEERLKKLIAKKQRLPRYRSDPQKLAKYLVNQGFDWSLVKQNLIDQKKD